MKLSYPHTAIKESLLLYLSPVFIERYWEIQDAQDKDTVPDGSDTLDLVDRIVQEREILDCKLDDLNDDLTEFVSKNPSAKADLLNSLKQDTREVKKRITRHEIEKVIDQYNAVNIHRTELGKLDAKYFKEYMTYVDKMKDKFIENCENYISNGKPSHESLDDIFIEPSFVAPCIDALKNVTPPIIDSRDNYLLGEHEKGSIVAWCKILKDKGKIINISSEKLSPLLNKKFHGLDLAKDGRTLRNWDTLAYTKYLRQFRSLIP
jgi:hypothetical protein